MDKSLKTGIAAAVAAVVTLWSAQASAEFYVGGGVGDSTIEASESFEQGSLDFNENDTAWKLFGGYMFSEYLGLEGAYFDLGSPAQRSRFDGGEGTRVRVDLRAEMTGYTLQGVAAYPFRPFFGVFAKLGVVSYDAEIEAQQPVAGQHLRVSDDGEELAYGIGAKYVIDKFALRAEWDIFDVGDLDDVSMWSVGAEFHF